MLKTTLALAGTLFAAMLMTIGPATGKAVDGHFVRRHGPTPVASIPWPHGRDEFRILPPSRKIKIYRPVPRRKKTA